MQIIEQLRRKGIKVVLICPKYNSNKDFDKEMERKGVKVVRIPFKPPMLMNIKGNTSLITCGLRLLVFYFFEYLISLIFFLKRRIKSHVLVRYSIITLPISFVIRMLNIKAVADVPELPLGSYISNIPNIFRRIGWILDSKLLPWYSAYRVMSLETKQYLVKIGIGQDKIHLIPPCFNFHEIPVFELKNIPNATIGYFGILEWWQGLEVLLESFSNVVKRYPHAKLFIIGEGPLRSKLEQLATDLGILSKVFFIRAVPRTKLLNEYFRKFRIVVIPRLPKTPATSTPMKLLEALAAGKVVITTPFSGISKYLQRVCIIVKPNDSEMLTKAILNVIQNEHYQFEISKNARKCIMSLYNRDKIISKIINILKL